MVPPGREARCLTGIPSANGLYSPIRDQRSQSATGQTQTTRCTATPTGSSRNTTSAAAAIRDRAPSQASAGGTADAASSNTAGAAKAMTR